MRNSPAKTAKPEGQERASLKAAMREFRYNPDGSTRNSWNDTIEKFRAGGKVNRRFIRALLEEIKKDINNEAVQGVISGKQPYHAPAVETVPAEDMTPTEKLRFDVENKKARKDEKVRIARESVIESFESIIQRIPAPDVRYLPPVYDRAYSPEEICLMISDVHIGEKVDLCETQGLSEYNVSIYEQECIALQDALASILPRHLERTPCPRFNIFMLGDIISNKIIYPTQAEHVDLELTYQVLAAASKLGAIMAWLSVYYPWDIEVWCQVGNHGRLGKRGEFTRAADNWDFMTYHYLASQLRGFTNIHFHIPPHLTMLVEIMNTVFVCNHGDAVRGWAGVPYYGFDRAQGRYAEMYGRRNIFIDYWLAGHFHTGESTESRIINGAWPGGSDLSVNQLQKDSEPMQMLFGVHEKHKVVWKRSLYLREEAPMPTIYKAESANG